MGAERLSQELAAVEAALASLGPAPSTLQRDRLMYLAGQAAGRRRARLASWTWTGTAAAATIAACVLGILLLGRSGPGGNPPIAETPAARPAQTELPSPQWATTPPTLQKTVRPLDAPVRYLELRRLVLTRGVEALPELTPSVPPKEQRMPTPIHGRMLEELLDG
jgi:hypothetical protein